MAHHDSNVIVVQTNDWFYITECNFKKTSPLIILIVVQISKLTPETISN